MIGTYILKRQTFFRWINRKYWVRPINIRRPMQGDFDHLLQEMKTDMFLYVLICSSDIPECPQMFSITY